MDDRQTLEAMQQRLAELENALREARQTNSNLQEKLGFLEAIIDNTNLPIYLKNADYRYILINREFGKLAHVNTTEISGKDDFAIFPEPVAALFRSQDEEVKKQNTLVEFEESIPLADGIHSFITAKFPLHDKNGNIYAIAGVCTDITRQQQVARELFESKEKIRTILDNAPIMINGFDVEGHCRMWNKECERIFGWTEEEVAALPDPLGVFYPDPETRKHVLQQITEASGAFTETVHCPVTRNGDIRRQKWANFTLPSGDLICVGLDITEQLQAEEQKNRLQEQLRHAQKLEAIGRLAGGIAHDFNNILNSLFGFTQLLQRATSPEDTRSSLIQGIFLAARRARDLIKQILIYSRRSERNMQPVFMQSILEETLLLLQTTTANGITVSQEIDPDCPAVLADATEIRQLYLNLITNAQQAMEEKGGDMKIILSGETVTKNNDLQLPPGAYAKMTISDTGCGIAPDALGKIFDPYFTTRAFKDGSGLGLAISEGIVKSLNGCIKVSSILGERTDFVVMLPALADKIEPAAVLPPAEVETKSAEHILFVDDEELNIHVWSIILRKAGFSITSCKNGMEALQLVQESPEQFDLILSDQQMPKMNGSVLAKKLQEQGLNIPFILSTGWGEAFNKEDLQTMGIRKILFKPHESNELLETIRAEINRKPPTANRKP